MLARATSILKKPLETFRLLSYTKPQTLAITQHHRLHPTKKTRYFIVPLPIKTPTQQLINLPTTAPTSQRAVVSKNYSIAVFYGEGIKTTDITVDFVVRTSPTISTTKAPFPMQKQKNFSIKNNYINPSDPAVVALVARVGVDQDILTTAARMYEFVLGYLTYGNVTDGLYSYRDAIKMRTVDCGGFCTLLASLLGNVGIESRLVVGFLATPKKNASLIMHVWLEIVLPDRTTFPLDPSVDWRRRKGQSTRWGGFGFVGSDRIVFSYGADHTITIGESSCVVPFFQQPTLI